MPLRRATADDLEFLVDLAADESVAAYLYPGAGERDALEERIAAANEPEGLWLIVYTDGARLGALELSIVSLRSRLASLSRVMVAPASRRHGVAVASVRAICRMAFQEHGLHRVQAEVYGDNVAGQRLFERAGFTREGVRRRAYWRREQWLDGVLFGLLAEELAS